MWCRPKKRRLTVFYGDQGRKIETYTRTKKGTEDKSLSVVSPQLPETFPTDDVDEACVKPNSITEQGSSGGQSVSNRLSKQLKSLNKKLKDCLLSYNQSFGTSVSFDMIKDTETSDFWKNSTIPDKLYYPPLSIRQQAINLKNMIDRSKEEQDMVKEEMISSIEYYKVHHAHFLDLYKSINHPNGKKCVAAKEGLYLEKKIADLVDKFQKFIGEKDCPSTFTEILHITHCESNFFDILESDTEDLSDIEEI